MHLTLAGTRSPNAALCRPLAARRRHATSSGRASTPCKVFEDIHGGNGSHSRSVVTIGQASLGGLLGTSLRGKLNKRGGNLTCTFKVRAGGAGADVMGASSLPNDGNGAMKKWEVSEVAGEVLQTDKGGDGQAVNTKGDVPEGYIEDDCIVPHRWRVTAMIALAFVLCNMDKVNMSVAVIPMADDLGWSATSRGIVQSAFFFGYTATQIPAGWISTKIGGAMVLMAGVAVWSFGTLVAPMAAHSGFMLLCLSRVLVGLGEGFAPSAATAVLAKQVPENERSRAVATVFGGLDLGSAIGLLICGPLIRLYGWPCVFYLFAIVGLVWCLAWPLVQPKKVDAIMWRNSIAEGSTSANGTTKSEDQAKVPWSEFFKSAPVWAVITAHFCFNWGYYTLLSWLPSFFQLALKLDVQNSSFLTVIPYVAMTFMTPLVGPAADTLVQRGVAVTTVRKLFQGFAFVGSAACMIACGLITPQNTAVGACSRAGLYCNHQDLSPRYASALLGISNTAGALPGILGVWSAGYLLDLTGSWSTSLFYPIAATQLFGLLIYTMFGSSKRQSWS